MLGDGRAILLGEHLAPGRVRFDIQLKGSGRTPFSRRGDGKAALGPMLREYLISEAMHALGIPTTRSLAVVATGEVIYRDTALPGAVLTRVATSHLRVGTFEYAAALDLPGALTALINYTINRHYPEAREADRPALALFESVLARQADLIAQWLAVGFVHGVMNTDNMALSGETIDYGPCAFLDRYHPEMVFSSIDQGGRYAYANQPSIAQWNLARFAETLLPQIDPNPQRALDIARETLETFTPRFQQAWLGRMRAKLGLVQKEEDDLALIQGFLRWMAETGADFSATFRMLPTYLDPAAAPQTNRSLANWLEVWRARLQREGASPEVLRERMNRANPRFTPRNARVEEALIAAVEGNLGPFQRLLRVLARPFDDQPENSDLAEPPADGGIGYRTFCGT
ncbi:MAG: YdiU family protein [Candidatus Methylacidiphilales bacterium]